MKRNPVGQLLLLGLGVVLFIACEVKRPKGVLTEAEMEAVLYDYHLAKVMAEEVPYSEAYRRPRYRDGVFVKHGITEAQFDSSMVWYTRHTKVLADMYERITKRFKEANDAVNHLIALRDMPAMEMPSGDSAIVWTLHRHELLTPVPLNSRLYFELQTDTTFHERDSLCFALRYRYYGSQPDTLQGAVMALTLHYRNDSVLHTWQRLLAVGEDSTALYLHSDTLGALRTVSGFVYLPNGPQPTTLRLLQARVLRYHAKDSLQVTPKDEAALATPSAPATPAAQQAPEVKQAPATPATQQTPAARRTTILKKESIKKEEKKVPPQVPDRKRNLPPRKAPTGLKPIAQPQ